MPSEAGSGEAGVALSGKEAERPRVGAQVSVGTVGCRCLNSEVRLGPPACQWPGSLGLGRVGTAAGVGG